jgi:TolB-like protein/DNA-binding winged helix-turn-helix (wHTH) protein/Tfp pilus assembly protein PilF
MTVRRFGVFELNLRTGELRKDGRPVKLPPQPFKVLALLVERSGDLVLRDDLKRALWGEETYVDFERGLNFCINQVRHALGDSSDTPRFIETVPRRGYRFIAHVERPAIPPAQVEVGDARKSDRDQGPSGRTTVAAGIGFLAVLVTGAFYLARPVTPPASASGRLMIAVLPFDDLTGDAARPYFVDGLTEEVIAQLGRVSPARIGVIARTSAMTYRGSSKSIAQIGGELGVSHVLEGSVRREGDRLRIATQLVDVSDQAQVWSETYDRTVHGALTLQSEVAAQVSRALAIELVPRPFAQPSWTDTRSPEARDAYLRGKYYQARMQPGDLPAALREFQDAIRLDSSFAAAHAAQADIYHLLAMFGQVPPAEAYPQAAIAAREAVRLDPDLADAHAAVGIVQLWGEWNAAAAARSFERAVTLNPSDAAAHHDFAWALVALQRFDEAVAHITRARELDPVSPRASNDVGWLYLQIRQPAEAARACRQTLAIDPDSLEAQSCLERAHLQRGQHAEALSTARTMHERMQGTLPAALRADGSAAFRAGGSPADRMRALWRWRLDRLQAAAADRFTSPYTIATHHIMLGEDELALERLEEAFTARAGVMVLLHTDPLFETLRSNPQFIKLLERIQRRT